MYVCVCAAVAESEVRSAIRNGARCEVTVGDACGAGTGCGSCLGRIHEMIASLAVVAPADFGSVSSGFPIP